MVKIIPPTNPTYRIFDHKYDLVVADENIIVICNNEFITFRVDFSNFLPTKKVIQISNGFLENCVKWTNSVDMVKYFDEGGWYANYDKLSKFFYVNTPRMFLHQNLGRQISVLSPCMNVYNHVRL